MEMGSFENSEVAAVLNEGSVSIKMDHEERPDIDAVYMAILSGDGGFGQLAADNSDDGGSETVLCRGTSGKITIPDSCGESLVVWDDGFCLT
jgi:hypothetical protein